MQILKTNVTEARHMTELKIFGDTLLLGHRFGDLVTPLPSKRRNIPYHSTMDKVEVGTDNIYFEMESKKGTEARTHDEGNSKSKIPATKRASIETSALEAKKKGQPLKERDTVAFRPMLLVAAAVVADALLTAVATLVLALTMMLSRNNSTASKDSTNMYGE